MIANGITTIMGGRPPVVDSSCSSVSSWPCERACCRMSSAVISYPRPLANTTRDGMPVAFFTSDCKLASTLRSLTNRSTSALLMSCPLGECGNCSRGSVVLLPSSRVDSVDPMQNQLSGRARLGDGSARSSEKPKRIGSVRKAAAPGGSFWARRPDHRYDKARPQLPSLPFGSPPSSRPTGSIESDKSPRLSELHDELECLVRV